MFTLYEQREMWGGADAVWASHGYEAGILAITTWPERDSSGAVLTSIRGKFSSKNIVQPNRTVQMLGSRAEAGKQVKYHTINRLRQSMPLY